MASIRSSSFDGLIIRRSSVPVVNDFVLGTYLKPEGNHGFVIGSLGPEEADHKADPDSYPQSPDFQTSSSFCEALTKRFPDLADASIQGGWTGVVDVTPDWSPIIEQIPDVPGFYCAAGFSGHGFKLSPAVGQIVSELIVSGQCTTFDISPFSLRRFAQGRPNQAQYSAFSIIG